MLAQVSGFEEFDLVALLPWAGLALGVAFGMLAQRSRFCLRSAAIAGAQGRLAPMAGVYAVALLVAILGTQALDAAGLVALEEVRFRSEALPLGALLVGGLMFGAGMVLTRGCASRLTVLTAQGNLRALLTLLVFGATAYAAMRGLLAAPRLTFAEATAVPVGADGALSGLLGVSPVLAAGLAALGLGAVALRSGARPLTLAAGAGIGLLVVAGWFATGALLYDDFDPRAAESLAFTAGAGDALFFAMAGTAVEPSFFAGIVGGVLLGAFAAAAAARELTLESFETPRQTLRYLLGAALMGVGGVLAGGCTIGAGLTGVSTLSLGPALALLAILAGAAATHRLVDAPAESGPAYALPAE